jgi:hypothetical protein
MADVPSGPSLDSTPHYANLKKNGSHNLPSNKFRQSLCGRRERYKEMTSGRGNGAEMTRPIWKLRTPCCSCCYHQIKADLNRRSIYHAWEKCTQNCRLKPKVRPRRTWEDTVSCVWLSTGFGLETVFLTTLTHASWLHLIIAPSLISTHYKSLSFFSQLSSPVVP